MGKEEKREGNTVTCLSDSLSPSAVSATGTSPSAEEEAACNEEVEATQQRDV